MRSKAREVKTDKIARRMARRARNHGHGRTRCGHRGKAWERERAESIDTALWEIRHRVTDYQKTEE